LWRAAEKDSAHDAVRSRQRGNANYDVPAQVPYQILPWLKIIDRLRIQHRIGSAVQNINAFGAAPAIVVQRIDRDLMRSACEIQVEAE
jgi:hypothetical protein